jgi:hypothetical protein
MDLVSCLSNLIQHIEDSVKVNVIRNGKLVEVYYNELTPDECRAAEAIVNDLYNYY